MTPTPDHLLTHCAFLLLNIYRPFATPDPSSHTVQTGVVAVPVASAAAAAAAAAAVLMAVWLLLVAGTVAVGTTQMGYVVLHSQPQEICH